MADESVVVVDVGSSCIKAGYSGDDIPCSVFPCVSTAWSKYTESIEESPEFSNGSMEGVSGGSESIHPMSRGRIKDWTQISKLWSTILTEVGASSSDSTSIMLVENPLTKPSDRKKWAEILFETYRAPSLCFGNSSSMSIFASGRTSGVVVDLGAGITSSVPVMEGLALKHAEICVERGGQDVSFRLKKLLGERNIRVSLDDARVVKEAMAYVDATKSSTSVRESTRPSEKVTVNLPDGTEVDVESRIFADCTNVLFNYDVPGGYPKGIVQQIYESISLVDDSLRKEMMNNVILAGGTSMLPNLGDRIGIEVTEMFAVSHSENNNSLSQTGRFHEVRVIPNSYYRESGYTNQRRFAPWIGGSIFGSMETYNDLKLTRQEWEESGERVLQTKCY